MKVIHYCGTFSKLSETFIYDVIVELNNSDIINKVIANKVINLADRPFDDITKLKCSYKDMFIGGFKKLMGIIGIYSYQSALQAEQNKRNCLKKILKIENPDIIHAHFGAQGWVVLPVALSLKIPLVVSFHGYDAFRLPNEAGWLAKLQALFAGASFITVVSEVMRQHLHELGCPIEKLKLIHVGKKLTAYPFQEGTAKPIRHFVSIGRLQSKKGYLDCVKAFSLLVEKFPDIRLQIIGTGEMESVLKAEVASGTAIKNIEFLGAMAHKDAKQLLSVADAFILCSKIGINGDMEGIPVVLMEAQALGIPSVSTKHSGIPEVIPPENQWLLAEEGNVKDIASKIENLINAHPDALKQLRLLGRRKIESAFNLETEVAKLRDLYNSLYK